MLSTIPATTTIGGHLDCGRDLPIGNPAGRLADLPCELIVRVGSSFVARRTGRDRPPLRRWDVTWAVKHTAFDGSRQFEMISSVPRHHALLEEEQFVFDRATTIGSAQGDAFGQATATAFPAARHSGLRQWTSAGRSWEVSWPANARRSDQRE